MHFGYGYAVQCGWYDTIHHETYTWHCFGWGTCCTWLFLVPSTLTASQGHAQHSGQVSGSHLLPWLVQF